MKIQNYKKLLFENLGIRQTIFKNAFWLLLAESVIRVLGLTLIIYAARILGATQYGKFAFALSFVSVVVVLADLGLSDITTRELSRDKEAEKEYPAIVFLKVLLGIGALILMIVGSFFITSDPVVQRAIWTLAFFIIITSFLNIIYAFLRARQKMEYEAGIKILQTLMITGLGFFVLFKFPSAENLSYSYLLANLLVLILVLFFFYFRLYPLRLESNKAIWKRFLTLSWPLSLGFVASWIYVNIDSIMLGSFGQVTETGWYNAASKIALAVIVSASLVSKSFFPVLSKFFQESREKLQRAWHYQMETMIILSLPLTAGGVVLAPKIINSLYGSSYSPSVLAFQILIFMTGISFLYYPYSMILVVSGQQRKHFALILTGAAVNIALNFILIPRYSLFGAALATVIASFVTLFLAIMLAKRFTPVCFFRAKLLKIFLGALFSSALMFMIIREALIYNLNFFLSVLFGGVAYPVFFLGGRKLLRRFPKIQ